ncbi:unnamed protein product [Prunus armeniaca]
MNFQQGTYRSARISSPQKVRRGEGDFWRDFGGGTCGRGDFQRLIHGGANKMSESSDRESHDPTAFGGEDTESEEPNQYVCSEAECSQTEGVVEGMIESRMVVHDGERGERSVDSREAE